MRQMAAVHCRGESSDMTADCCDDGKKKDLNKLSDFFLIPQIWPEGNITAVVFIEVYDSLTACVPVHVIH